MKYEEVTNSKQFDSVNTYMKGQKIDIVSTVDLAVSASKFDIFLK